MTKVSDAELASAIRQVDAVIERHGGRDEVPKLLGIELDALRELQSLRAEVAGLRKDAERWRAEMEMVEIPDKRAPANPKCQHDLQVKGNSIYIAEDHTFASCVYCGQLWKNAAIDKARGE